MNNQITDCAPALASVQDAWNAAAKVWNPQALAALYLEDALFYGGRAGHSVGSDAIRTYFDSYEGVIKSAHLTLIEQEILRLDGGSFVAQGYGDFSFVLEGGASTKSIMRTTLIIVKQDDRLKIRLHHFSVTPDVPPLGQS